MNLLTREEIEELTKAKQPGKQADIMDANGIYYIKRGDGTVTTTWYHVNHPYIRTAHNDEEPDFDKIA